MTTNRRFEVEAKDEYTAIFGMRHMQCLLLFCAFFVAFTMRVNISVAIVAMADKNIQRINITHALNITINKYETPATNQHQQFNWNEKTKSYVLSSFFWGSVLCAYMWGFYLLLTETPTYMKYILGMDISSNGLLSALPFVAYIVMGFVYVWLDRLMAKCHWCSAQVSRKIFTSISSCVPAASLIALGYVSSNHVHLAVFILIIAMGANAAYFVGWNMNNIELSPNFAGILMGLINFPGGIMSLLAPLTVGFVITDETNVNQWRIIFFITAAIYFFSNLIFLYFGSMKVQPWNEIKGRKPEIKFVRVDAKERHSLE